MVESKKALPKEPRTVGVGGMGVGLGGLYSSMSPPHTINSPTRYILLLLLALILFIHLLRYGNNNNVLYNRFNALSQYYNSQTGQGDQYDRFVNFDVMERQDNYNDSHYNTTGQVKLNFYLI